VVLKCFSPVLVAGHPYIQLIGNLTIIFSFWQFHVDVKEIRGIGLHVSRLENSETSKQGTCIIFNEVYHSCSVIIYRFVVYATNFIGGLLS
jgi:hypothetical protein